MHNNWCLVNHNGNRGYGGDIAIFSSFQARVYPLKVGLWRWEIRELPNRKLLFIGSAKTRELAKAIVENKVKN
jgi:hypothetical protein